MSHPPPIQEESTIILLDQQFPTASTKFTSPKIIDDSCYKLLQNNFTTVNDRREIPFSYQFKLKQVLQLDIEPKFDDDDEEDFEQLSNDDEDEENYPKTDEDFAERRFNEPITGGMPNFVTISQQFKCIILGTDGQLLFYNVDTKQFIKGIRFYGSISHAVIEKDGFRGGEAIIISFSHHIVEKYDLESLFKSEQCKVNVKPLWSIGTKLIGNSGTGFTDDDKFNWPEMITICYSNKYDSFRSEQDEKKLGNIAFVCDKWNNRIKVLNTFDGKQLGMFGVKGDPRKVGTDIEFREPWGITLDQEDRILVSQFAGHSIKRLDIQDGKMVVDQVFGNIDHMYNPMGIVVDKFTNRLLIADSNERKITIIDMTNGEILDPVTNSSFRCVSDVCLNFETGELYVTDLYSEQFFIYE